MLFAREQPLCARSRPKPCFARCGLLTPPSHDELPKQAVAFFTAPNQGFNGDGLLRLYVRSARKTKEVTMPSTPVATLDHHKWISCSHWGLFPVPGKSS
jgi:hypothetical protein